MEISKDNSLFSIIERHHSHKDLNNNWHIEFHNETSWTETEYVNFANVMKSFGFKEEIENQYLNASVDDTVLEINGISNILKYCITNNYKNLKAKWYKVKSIFNDNIDDLIDSKLSFTLVSNIDSQEPNEWNEQRKYFKINKKINYIDVENNVKYIVNIAKFKDKDGNNNYYSLGSSGIVKSQQKYEFFIDITNTHKDNILPSIIKMEQALKLTTYILSKQQQNDIIQKYGQMIKNDIVIKGYPKHNKPPLITPKPITLEKINLLNPDDYGVVSILSEYTVTEKADGERLLMYIDNTGKIYLIDNTYRVIDTGLEASQDVYNSLIDGEYILCHKRKDSSTCSLYAAFDIYYYAGKKVTQFPLMEDKGSNTNESRYKYLQNILKYIKTSKNSIDFIVKEHLYSKDILNDCRKILQGNNTYLYDIDGLIFTPAKLALYSYYSNKPVQITDNVKWDRVFKWKPPEQNTIDFLVKTGQNVIIDGQKYKELYLYVGYNASQWEDYTINEALKIHYDKDYRKTIKDRKLAYIPKLFKPAIYYSAGVEKALVKITGYGEIRCESGDKIEGESIVEFRYILDETLPISMRWVPMRIREDKTRVYKMGELSKTANDMSVAINIWRSIHNPVSESIITGSEKIYNKDIPETEERLLDTDDIYYSRNIPRDALLSYNMLQFHNLCIKKMLYSKPMKKGSLVELACGEGGDMPRWLDNGYKFILGMDLVKNNIYGPRSGAYSRMLNRRNNFAKKVDNEKITFTDMVFVVGDCGKPIMTGECSSSLKDQDSVNTLQLVLNKKRGNVQKHYNHIAGQGANGFDACSCMFSIHYFFKSEETLNTFLDNVSKLLKKDGIFFCTFMDGKNVEESIENAGGDIIEGRKNGIPVWAIIRRFNKEFTSKYNKKIDVYIESTNRFIPEYIVSYEHLVEKCQSYNLSLIETEMFAETFNREKLNVPADDSAKDTVHRNILELDKDPIQKQFSFFNRWCIFKKI
jgi:hypothetical protein